MSLNQYQCDKALPYRAGVGLKSEHYHAILEEKPDIGWFEVHPENYMGAGGPPHYYLTQIRNSYPLSLHGVGLSIGGANDLNKEHLQRLKDLVDRYQPGRFSEHLAWCTHTDIFYNDLLPLPYTDETLNKVCEHVDEVQTTVGQQMLLENPATYVVFDNSTYEEIEFIKAIARRSGCGLLLDVNNVYVSCINHNRDPKAYIDQFPLELVGEIHLAGHATDQDDEGKPLLIDAHDREVLDKVWDLYEHALKQRGPVPTLIEWDNDIPDWPTLFKEALLAEEQLSKVRQPDTREVA